MTQNVYMARRVLNPRAAAPEKLFGSPAEGKNRA
jgi:hypothetical protein